MIVRFSLFSPVFKMIAAAAVLAGCIAALTPAQATTERRVQATFDLELRGLRAGSIVFSGASNANAYSVAVRLESAGLVNLIRRIRYDGQVQGRVGPRSFAPRRYEDRFDNGRRLSTMVMEFEGRTPMVVARTPEREPAPYDVEPGSQTGAVDILTALFAVFRDAPRAEICDLDLPMFDGRRRTQLVVDAPAEAGATVTCAGEYRRIAGFPPDEMAERTRYPFVLVYVAGSDGLMRLQEVRMESTQGSGRLIRR
jgi:hypothetical protein